MTVYGLEGTHDASKAALDNFGLGHGHMLAPEYAHNGENIPVEDRPRFSVRLLSPPQLGVDPRLEDGEPLGNLVRVRTSIVRRDKGVPAILLREALPIFPSMVVFVQRAMSRPVLSKLLRGKHSRL